MRGRPPAAARRGRHCIAAPRRAQAEPSAQAGADIPEERARLARAIQTARQFGGEYDPATGEHVPGLYDREIVPLVRRLHAQGVLTDDEYLRLQAIDRELRDVYPVFYELAELYEASQLPRSRTVEFKEVALAVATIAARTSLVLLSEGALTSP